MGRLGAWNVLSEGTPQKLVAATGILEAKLESWIEAEPSMLGSNVRWISRQLVLPDRSRLDLLGLTPDGTWVIAELKAGAPDGNAVRQALHYFMVMDEMTNADLIDRIRAQGAAARDPLAEQQLTEILELDQDDYEREYRLLVAGIGDGGAADQAASTLKRHGLNIPVDVITFSLFTNAVGGYTLVREIEDEIAGAVSPTGQGHTLDGLLETARRFNVLEDFEAVRGEILRHGYRSWQRKHGINFNRGNRRQVLWAQPKQDGVHMGYLTWNFPVLFGISEEDATAELGTNWVTLKGAEATAQIAEWLEGIEKISAQHEVAPE